MMHLGNIITSCCSIVVYSESCRGSLEYSSNFYIAEYIGIMGELLHWSLVLSQMMHNVPLCSDVMLLYVKGIIEKVREFQKNIYFCCIDYVKVFGCRSQQTMENSSRDGNTRSPYLPS